MLHAPGTGHEDHLLAAGDGRRQPHSLAADAREVRGKAVKVLLPPHFKGMMMAFGTLQADAEEQLADQWRDLIRLAPVAKHRDRTVLERTSLRGQQIADKLVIREVPA